MRIEIKRLNVKDENTSEKLLTPENLELKKAARRQEILNKMHASLKPETVKVPAHFPCAARVKMPQLGSEDSEIKIRKSVQRSSLMFYNTSDLSQQPVQNAYVKRISRGLQFEEDVIKDRCFHTLPYDSKYFWEVLSLDGLVPLPPKTRIPVGRHNARGTDKRHMPCGIAKVTKSHQLKPLKRKIMQKAMQMHQQAIMASMEEERNKANGQQKSDDEEDTDQSIFITEVAHRGQKVGSTVGSRVGSRETPRSISSPTKTIQKEDKPKESTKGLGHIRGDQNKRLSTLDEKEEVSQKVLAETLHEGPRHDNDWDAYLLSILSPLTANWVVHERMTPSEDKENLSKILSGWYGEPDHTDLVRDDVSVTDLDMESEKDKKKKAKKDKPEKELTFFEKIKAEIPKRAVDPYSDNNQAPFYRQPAGLRRQRKTEEREEAGAINSTAHAVTVRSYQPSPPPTLRDFINPAVGHTMYDTDNMFQQEWLTGAQQVYNHADPSKIVMETDNRYRKRLQKEYPVSPQCWNEENERDKVKAMQDPGKGINRGLRRWQSLPEPVDDTAEVVNIVPPGYDAEFHRSPDPTTKRITKQNASLMQIIGEWRTKWHLSGQYADSNPEDLIRDMADIQPHVRLKAIATIAKASEYKPPTEAGIHLEYKERQDDSGTQMPDEIYIGLNYLLDDEHTQVQKAAAITLYSLNRPTEKAETILKNALFSESGVDRWAAAQCLAHFGVCDSDVVGEIINQLLDTEDSIKHERAIMLLARISNNSTLVHSKVAEQLNSTSWRHKVIACKIFPTLHGTINKDISNKLSELMWNDWHTDVRRAAAQCLGKTQHGRDVHDDLKDRILSSNERIRLEAISRIGQLGIMTAKLLPAFLKCFDDPYVSVRVETCITSGNLEIQDGRVLEKLVYLATYDPIWKIKAIAIQALGNIGVATDEINECLMWAMRYEEKEGVRAEACHSLVALKMTDEDFVEVLQDRLLVETSQIVRDEMVEALRQLGVSTTEDMDMVAQIKGEVRKLCKRDVIASHIMVNEMDDNRRENLKRMVYETERELERNFNIRNLYLNMVTQSDMDARLHVMYSPVTKKQRYQEHQAKKEKVLQRIRSLSRVGSSGTLGKTSGSRTSSAGLSREGTLFTPSADKELEALMSREDTKEDLSDGATPTTGSITIKSRENTVTGTSSRPGTSVTRSDSQVSSGGEEGERTKRIKSGTSSKSKTLDSSEYSISECDTPRLNRMDSVPEQAEKMESILEQGKTASNLQLPGLPGVTGSAEDTRASRMSFIGGGTSERKALISREAMKEREKVSSEALNTYMGLNSRYSDLNIELMAIDSGLNTSDNKKPSSRDTHKAVSASAIGSLSQGTSVTATKSVDQAKSSKDNVVEVTANESQQNDDQQLESKPDDLPEKVADTQDKMEIQLQRETSDFVIPTITVQTDTPVETGTPDETGTQVETDSKVETDAVVETDVAVETNAAVETDASVETDGAVESCKPVESKTMLETESRIEDESKVESQIQDQSDIKVEADVAVEPDNPTGPYNQVFVTEVDSDEDEE